MDDHRGGHEPRYGFGSFLLEPHQRRLMCRGTPVALGPKLFDLLHLLAREQGHVVPRARIVEALWPEVVVSETALRQKVWLLRGLLRAADPTGPEWLETVPRRGYRLAAAAACEPASGQARLDRPLTIRPAMPAPGGRTTRPAAVPLRLAAVPLLLALFVCSPHGAMPPAAGPAVAATPDRGQSVTILRLTSRSTGPEDGWVATAFTEVLRAELAAARGLHLIPADTVERVAARLRPTASGLSPDGLTWVRKAVGTDLVVAGSLVVTGSGPDAHLRVDLLVQCTRSREVAASVTRSGRRRDLTQLAASAARELRRALAAGAIAGEKS